MKIKLLTGHDAKYNKIAALTLPNMQSKAAELGIELHTYTESLDTTRPPSWSKILFLKEHLPDSDYCFYMDIDSFFVDFSYTDLYGMLPVENCFIGWINEDVWQTKNPIHRGMHPFVGNKSINCGHLIFKNCQKSLEFLDEVYDTDQEINHGWWEQRRIHELLKNNKEWRDQFSIHPVAKLINVRHPLRGLTVDPTDKIVHVSGGVEPNLKAEHIKKFYGELNLNV